MLVLGYPDPRQPPRLQELVLARARELALDQCLEVSPSLSESILH